MEGECHRQRDFRGQQSRGPSKPRDLDIPAGPVNPSWNCITGYYDAPTEPPQYCQDSFSEPEQGLSQPTLDNFSSDETSSSDANGQSAPRTTLVLAFRVFHKCQGSQLVIGPSSNLSLLHIFRQVTYYALGPNDFTKAHPEDDMPYGTPPPPVDWSQATVEPPRPSEAQARHYIRWYAITSGCVFDLLSNEDLEAIIPWLREPPTFPDAATTCINFLVLATGALCGPQNCDAEASLYFTYGRFLASTRFSEAPSVSMLQIHSLIVNYLLCSSRPIAASMHLAMAVRAADSLGLQRADVSALFSHSDCLKRERIWKVLRVADLHLSSSLGQMPSTIETRDTVSTEPYSATLDLSSVFEKVLRGLYAKQDLSLSVLEQISQHHREWATRFRKGMVADQILSESDYLCDDMLNGKAEFSVNIGIYRLKGGYYWTVMLVTRPYLVDLMNRRFPYDGRRVCSEIPAPEESEKYALLAHASVNAALQTVELLKPMLSGLDIPRRLAYEVNFIFNAAVVLGIGFFADLDRVFPIVQVREERRNRRRLGKN